MAEFLILVDEKDNQIGTEEKLAAHLAGKLHRAISVHIINSKGELMLQKRAKTKYHSGGLWTNTCCSHPRPGEDTLTCAQRRLREEMGFDADLQEVHSFVYKVPLDNGVTEHEYLHVHVGYYDGEPILNPEEADDWRWITLENLRKEIQEKPETFSYWFQHSFEEVLKKAKELKTQ